MTYVKNKRWPIGGIITLNRADINAIEDALMDIPASSNESIDNAVDFIEDLTVTTTELNALEGTLLNSQDLNTLTNVTQTLEAPPVDGVQATLTIEPGVDGNDAVTYTAVNYGTASEELNIEHLGGVSQELSVVMTYEPWLLTVQLATDELEAVTSTAAQVVAAVNGYLTASLFVTASYQGTGAGLAGVAAAAPLANGVDVTEGNVGTFRTDGTDLFYKITAQSWKKVTLGAL